MVGLFEYHISVLTVWNAPCGVTLLIVLMRPSHLSLSLSQLKFLPFLVFLCEFFLQAASWTILLLLDRFCPRLPRLTVCHPL